MLYTSLFTQSVATKQNKKSNSKDALSVSGALYWVRRQSKYAVQHSRAYVCDGSISCLKWRSIIYSNVLHNINAVNFIAIQFCTMHSLCSCHWRMSFIWEIYSLSIALKCFHLCNSNFLSEKNPSAEIPQQLASSTAVADSTQLGANWNCRRDHKCGRWPTVDWRRRGEERELGECKL